MIDISQKILYDNIKTERKYLAYMNSTLSHEMRNPLNSINSQIQLIKSSVQDLTQFKTDVALNLNEQSRKEFDEFIDDLS